MPNKPSSTTPAVTASDVNADIILDRIATSDRHTTEIFTAHEERNQERFKEQSVKLEDTRKHLGESLDNLTEQVEETNGTVKQVVVRVAIVEDRAKVIAERAVRRMTWIQVATSVAGGSAFLAAVLGIIKLAGG